MIGNNSFRTPLGAILACAALVGCGPGSNVPGLDLRLEAADGKDHGPVVALAVAPDELVLQVAEVREARVMARFGDGAEVDATAHATLESATPELAEVGARAASGGFPVTGRAVGDARLVARLGTLSVERPQMVRPARLVSLALNVPDRLERRASAQLVASGTFADGSTEDLTARVTWRSADPAVVAVTAAGLATAGKEGEVEVVAELDGVSGAGRITVTCAYPAAARSIRAGNVIPAMSWEEAYRTDGAAEEVVRFGLEDVYCGRQFEDRTSIVFLVGAGWCSACPQYIQLLADQIEAIEAAGSMVVYIDAEDRSGNPAGSAFTNRHITGIVGKSPSVRVGDADTRPTAGLVAGSPIVRGFPTVFVVRTRDMMVYADQNASDYYIPIVDIVQHPEWDWTDPLSPVREAPSGVCAEGVEEASEPNDAAADATVISAPGSVAGGVCAEGPDFYLVELDGAWRARLRFDEAVGDLDLFVWNRRTNQPLVSQGAPVASFSTVGSEEVIEWSGTALLRVEGRFGDHAPYELVLEPR